MSNLDYNWWLVASESSQRICHLVKVTPYWLMRFSDSQLCRESVTFFNIRRQEFLDVGLVIAEMLARTQSGATGVELDRPNFLQMWL